ncbi:hypothetical protein LZ32DRAFT_95188 [Colletotrichum eremochloae]|nr:hypothetical protein LZ32DRAFT_95188 [Colletotrichum eremochloae]
MANSRAQPRWLPSLVRLDSQRKYQTPSFPRTVTPIATPLSSSPQGSPFQGTHRYLQRWRLLRSRTPLVSTDPTTQPIAAHLGQGPGSVFVCPLILSSQLPGSQSVRGVISGFFACYLSSSLLRTYTTCAIRFSGPDLWMDQTGAAKLRRPGLRMSGLTVEPSQLSVSPHTLAI